MAFYLKLHLLEVEGKSRKGEGIEVFFSFKDQCNVITASCQDELAMNLRLFGGPKIDAKNFMAWVDTVLVDLVRDLVSAISNSVYLMTHHFDISTLSLKQNDNRT